jgi:hypothetical protein
MLLPDAAVWVKAVAPGFMHYACELARPTAGIAALVFLETAATCRICHVNLFLFHGQLSGDLSPHSRNEVEARGSRRFFSKFSPKFFRRPSPTRVPARKDIPTSL